MLLYDIEHPSGCFWSIEDKTINSRTSSKSVVRHDWNISMTKQFQQRMSRFLQRWRTQRNAIRNANCTISESSKLWTQLALPCGVCLLECLWIPHTLLFIEKADAHWATRFVPLNGCEIVSCMIRDKRAIRWVMVKRLLWALCGLGDASTSWLLVFVT